MSRDKTELIWVDKEFAEEYKKLDDDTTQREEQIKILNKYLEGIKEVSRVEFKSNLDNLEEDVAIYTGLMLKVKQAFEKAKNEQLQDSYDLWEKFEEDIPNIKEKTAKIITVLDPLAEKLTQINDLLGKIQTWNFDKLIETIQNAATLYGDSKDMVEFLINNFTPKKEGSQ